jgi:predicted RNase H-like HicB family nuclease
MRASLEFNLPARIARRGKWFISSCPLLNVHSQGHSRSEAQRNLVDALASFLTSCYERRTLNTVLRDAGFEPTSRPGLLRILLLPIRVALA